LSLILIRFKNGFDKLKMSREDGLTSALKKSPKVRIKQLLGRWGFAGFGDLPSAEENILSRRHG
jgi:hypothetical protein